MLLIDFSGLQDRIDEPQFEFKDLNEFEFPDEMYKSSQKWIPIQTLQHKISTHRH